MQHEENFYRVPPRASENI